MWIGLSISHGTLGPYPAAFVAITPFDWRSRASHLTGNDAMFA